MKKSAVHDRLAAKGAYFKDVSGWEGPDWYAPHGVEPKVEKLSFGRQNWFPYWKAEHDACREGVILMDMSFMAKFLVQGRDAGKIKDLVVNMGSGKVHYAVLDLNERWGAGADDKLLPVALTSLSFPADRGGKIGIRLAPDQVNLAQAGIDEKRWENTDINDPTFKRNVDSYMRTASSPVPASSTGAAGRQGQEERERMMERERSGSRSGQAD